MQILVYFPVLLSCCFYFLIHPSFTFAGDSENPAGVHTLDPVVVSATKTPIPISHATSAVEVITEDDFKKRKIKTVVDALKLAQGVAMFSKDFQQASAAMPDGMVILDAADRIEWCNPKAEEHWC